MKSPIEPKTSFTDATGDTLTPHFREIIAYAQSLKKKLDKAGIGESGISVSDDGQHVRMFIAMRFNEPSEGPGHYTKQALAILLYADPVAKKPRDIIVTPFRETGDGVSHPTSHQAPTATFCWEQRNELVQYINEWVSRYSVAEPHFPQVYEKLMRRPDDSRPRNFGTLIKRVAAAVDIPVPARP